MWHNPATPALSSSICMPPDFRKLHDYSHGFYSPGICPMGYTEGCAFPTSLAVTSNGTPFFGGTLIPGETARICCPTGFTCYTSGLGADPDKTYSQCISTKGLSTFQAYNYGLDAYIMSTAYALVFAIQVRWQSSDLSKLETDPTVPGSKHGGPKVTSAVDPTGAAIVANVISSGLPGSVVETGQAATAGAGDAGDPPRGGISTGAIIAMGVAVPLVSLILGILAYFFWWRHNKKHSKPTEDEDKGGFLRDGVPSAALVSPMTPHTDFGNRTTEIDSGTVNEMDATTINEADPDAHPWMELETRELVQELPNKFVAELEGSAPRADRKMEIRRDLKSHLRKRSGSQKNRFIK